jgi:NADH-quinone oxidoreductase subunit H
LPGPLWELLKTAGVVVLIVVVGRRIPLIRPDRLVEIGWMVLIPATLLQALAVAVLVLTGFYA